MATDPEVRPGQVWADNDRRGYGRRVRVVEVHTDPAPGYAVVEQATPRRADLDEGKPGRRTRIRLDRFRPTSTGYRLVTDSPEE